MLVLVGLVSEWCPTVHVGTGWDGVSGILLYMLVLVGPVSEWCPVHVGTSWPGVIVVSYCTCWY